MSWTPPNAFVLAAGLGTRMRPLRADLPKPLVPLAGRALIDHVLDRIASSGITRTVVNVHHLADRLEGHLAARTSPEIVFSNERDHLLETGGGVMNALPLLGDHSFLVHNSDSVWMEGRSSALRQLFDAWDDARMDCLMLLADRTTSIGYDGAGDFNMSPYGRLTRRAAGETTPFVFTGVSITHPRLFDGAPKPPFSLNVPWNRAIADGRLYGVLLDGRWMHVGTPDAVTHAEQCMAGSVRV